MEIAFSKNYKTLFILISFIKTFSKSNLICSLFSYLWLQDFNTFFFSFLFHFFNFHLSHLTKKQTNQKRDHKSEHIDMMLDFFLKV